MPVHIPRPKIDKLVCQAQDVGIFTLCVNTRLTLASVLFVLVGQSPNFETVLQTIGAAAESGTHNIYDYKYEAIGWLKQIININ